VDGAIGNAEADYVYGFFELSRVTYLPTGFLLNTTASGQVSDSRLFVSEQFGLGGFNTVRGYDYREVNGDEGYLINVEIRSPALDSQDLLSKLKFGVETQLLAFWDFGYSRLNKPDLAETTDVYLASYGLGLRATVTDYVQTSVDYGWQLKDIESAAGNGRFHVNVTVVF
jgi:hemolysin activation/secretion protein